MREAVIVSTARTPLTKAHRGKFNITPGATLAAFAVKAAVERADIDPALIEDAILGCGYPEGTTGRNIARQSIIRAGLPISIAGTTVNRFCASGLQAIAMAAGRILVDGAPAMINEGANVVHQRIALRPLDVDVTFLYGYGFPRHRGGPMKYADTVGLAKVLADIREFSKQDPVFWKPSPLLVDLVERGADFASLNQD